MPAEELRGNRSVGGKAVRITVVGAVLIVVVAIAAVLLIRALTERRDGGSDPKQPHNGTDS